MSDMRRIRPPIDEMQPQSTQKTFIVKVQNQNGEPNFFKEVVVIASSMLEALFLTAQKMRNESIEGESVFVNVRPAEVLQ